MANGRMLGAFVMMGAAMVTSRGTSQPGGSSVLQQVDHLVYATPSLSAGIDQVEQLIGVRATPGGQHPGVGTRNALVSLGPATYLEIIGPDPDQPKPAAGRTFGIDTLSAPRLVGWAAKESDLERLVQNATAHDIALGPVTAGSRRTPQGTLLAWRFTSPRGVVADGIVPFFIDWGTSPHPAGSAAAGATLVAFRAEHPQPEQVQKMLRDLGLDLTVSAGAAPALIATVQCPRGRVDLR